jgi:hypothetical protein
MRVSVLLCPARQPAPSIGPNQTRTAFNTYVTTHNMQQRGVNNHRLCTLDSHDVIASQRHLPGAEAQCVVPRCGRQLIFQSERVRTDRPRQLCLQSDSLSRTRRLFSTVSFLSHATSLYVHRKPVGRKQCSAHATRNKQKDNSATKRLPPPVRGKNKSASAN